MERKYDECPDFAGGFKFAAALVLIGLIAAAAQSPIDWTPATTTVHDVAAAPMAPAIAPAEGFSSGYSLEGIEPATPIEQF